jgi:hypothetical protein
MLCAPLRLNGNHHCSLNLGPFSALGVISLPALYVYVSRTLAARKLAKTGIGKGAPGFLTGVKRVAVPPEIAARIQRGEYVSPEEIAACQQPADSVAAPSSPDGTPEAKITPSAPAEEENEWLPENLRQRERTKKAGPKKGKKK